MSRSLTPAKRSPVWLGGAASMMAVVVTHPIDQTKVRAQTQLVRQTMVQTFRSTYRNSGVLGLWIRLSGSLLRQATYGVARFGIYAWLKDRDQRLQGGSQSSASGWHLVKNGAISGLFAGLVGAPGELVMVRLCSDGVKPPSDRLNYRNALHGVYRIAKDEGLSRVFRGWQATCLRSIIMNAAQLSCYDLIKARLLRTGYFTDTVPTHLLTAACGGTIAVTLCAPVDVIKSRIQSSTVSGEGVFDVLARSLRKDGPRVLFRGWLPAWLRMTPTTTLTFMFLEQLKKIL